MIAVNLLDKQQEPIRVMNYMPLAHMFGCGTVVAITYLGKMELGDCYDFESFLCVFQVERLASGKARLRNS